MHVIVDGSYTCDISDVIRCGVIMVDELGFYEEKQFKKKHIEASSSFAEWFGVEKALEEILKVIKCSPVNEGVIIYTDYIRIVNIMNNSSHNDINRMIIQNKLLSAYICSVRRLKTKVEQEYESTYKTPINIEFRHLNSCLEERHIMRLHQKAHNIAQVNEPKRDNQMVDLKYHKYPKSMFEGYIELLIKLEDVYPGVRKWTIYENKKKLYQGKLREILQKYNRERYDIVILIEQNKLRADKETRRILNKYL